MRRVSNRLLIRIIDSLVLSAFSSHPQPQQYPGQRSSVRLSRVRGIRKPSLKKNHEWSEFSWNETAIISPDSRFNKRHPAL